MRRDLGKEPEDIRLMSPLLLGSSGLEGAPRGRLALNWPARWACLGPAEPALWNVFWPLNCRVFASPWYRLPR